MSIPVVAIVGRPNVGKSTLFNRLIGKREAIVDDLSGVTRDRNYGEADWSGRIFRVIDTGGYVPDSPDLFETAIREQIELAVNESAKILFVVDGRDGLTPVDREIAQRLRSSGKDCYLLVNKLDAEKYDNNIHEFYELGIGEPHPVAASTGRKLGDFLDLLVADLPERAEKEEDDRLKIAIVGKPNVGKSSLTNALLGYDRSIVTDIPGTTRDSIDSILKYYGEEIVLVDTAGLRRRTKIKENVEYFSTVRTLKAIAESTVTILMIDVNEGFERQDHRILEEAVRRRKAIIIAINKWDTYEDKDSNSALAFENELRTQLGRLDYLPIIFTSALTKQRIYKLVDLAKELHIERQKKIPTHQLNEDLLPILDEQPPPATPTGKEVKIRYITQVGEKYPVFLFFVNNPKYLPDSYKRFVEKQIRKLYGFFGVPFTMSFKEK